MAWLTVSLKGLNPSGFMNINPNAYSSFRVVWEKAIAPYIDLDGNSS